MKRLVILLGVLVGLSSMTFAQEKDGKRTGKKKSFKKEWNKNHASEEMAKIKTERLDEMVNLSESQKEQVYALHLENAGKKKELKEVTRKDRELMMQRFKAHQEAISGILSTEQQELLKEKRIAVRKDHQPRGKRNLEVKVKHRKGDKPSDDKIES